MQTEGQQQAVDAHNAVREDGVACRQRRVLDALARTLDVGVGLNPSLKNGEVEGVDVARLPLHPKLLSEPTGDGLRHIGLARQGGQLLFGKQACELLAPVGLPAQVHAQRVSEGELALDKAVAHLIFVVDHQQHTAREGATVVDEAAPVLSRLPEPVVASIVAEAEEDREREADELKGHQREREGLVELVAVVSKVDAQRREAHKEHQRPDLLQGRAAEIVDGEPKRGLFGLHQHQASRRPASSSRAQHLAFNPGHGGAPTADQRLPGRAVA